MSSEKRSSKKESGFEGIIKDLKQQLAEQLRCLDSRADTQAAVLLELQEFYRRRADVEQDYSRGLDKLHRSLTQRHKELKTKREQASLLSSHGCWQQLQQQTQLEARQRATLADIYGTVLPQKLARLGDDLQRAHRRCRQICTESHEEILKLINELQESTKTYNTYYALFSAAEAKLQYVVNQKAKLEVNLPEDKLDKSRKFRLVEKEIVKRRNKYQDTRLQALRARNDFLLCLEAANATMQRFFVEDLPDTLDCADAGVHATLGRALLMACDAQEGVLAGERQAVDDLRRAVSQLDARLDRQRFMEANNAPFMLPKKFEFIPYKGDIMSRYDVDPAILEETRSRYDALCGRIETLKTATAEQWKTMETAERSLLAMAATAELDCRAQFAAGRDPPPRPTETALAKQRGDQLETAQFYVTKFAELVSDSRLLARLQVKRELLRSGLSEHAPELERPARPVCAPRPRRPRLGRPPTDGQPRLFGGSLEEYVELSGQEIPLIVRSCVRVINLYGLHHQGIFRVSGSQVEINSFRDSFERGEDPLADVSDASDINSAAGVLKLYLRELREPIFPTPYFDQFMEIAQLSDPEERTARLREVISTLPHSVQLVMRYLFAFLSHLSEFSDENMMEPYNLAICFGPTLLPIPESKDQVQYQNLVNELMKHIILCHEEIFPHDGGPVYEKYISRQNHQTEEIGEAPSEVSGGAGDGGDGEPDAQSEDDVVLRATEKDLSMRIFGKCEQLEAVAQYDFTARSVRELSFRCGDVLTLYRQVSPDWWKGHFRGRDGLVPDKYIMLKIRDEERTSLLEPSPGHRVTVTVVTGPAPASSTSTLSTRSTASVGSDSAPSTSEPAVHEQQLYDQQDRQQQLQQQERAAPPERPESAGGGGGWVPDRCATLPRGGRPTPAPRASSLSTLHQPTAGVTTVRVSVPDDREEADSETERLERAIREMAMVSERLRAGQLSPEDEPGEESDPPPPAPASARAAPRRPPVAAVRQEPECSPPTSGSVLSRRALWETRAAAAAEPAGRLALKHTPDLVLDLPAEWHRLQRTSSGSSEEGAAPAPAPAPAPAAAPSTAAETFARQDQCTVRRGGRPVPVRPGPVVRPLLGGAGSDAAAARPVVADPTPAGDQPALLRPQAKVKPQPARKPSPKHRPAAAKPLPEE
ncbi:rho GTPase-activating protein 4-like isoform X1 [Amphibalanus amphitrite]|uniref:rho GTPase-activating protein 4-like isoform X1 n=1 Tax=Amphibalanus amphitrite TaxID=1232801 RepID=UPI001C91BF6F|nr:rho GTPase-activating protein 4-like isoform X1 [Amphibalanus amphitrite]XP_043245400.1 rho GTPase-activating protein 4-like isoform X1 [Amphibalanus amphitrite]